MRENIKKLTLLGPLPASNSNLSLIAEYDKLLSSITPPVTNEEAMALTKLFGQDDCYGLAWALIHLIETSPNVPLNENAENNKWLEILKCRVSNKNAEKL